eukprot:scaffold9676_cov113-Isochrysis_galbana.AAC.6
MSAHSTFGTNVLRACGPRTTHLPGVMRPSVLPLCADGRSHEEATASHANRRKEERKTKGLLGHRRGPPSAGPAGGLTRMEERKRREGDEAMAMGAKCEKSGWLKSKDLDGAAAAYERAATCYRVAKALPESISAYERAAAAHEALELGGGSAAKLLEAAALIAKDGLKAAANAADLYERASMLHAADGSLDLAGSALCKAGRAVEASDPKRACALMMRACALFDDEDEEPRLRGSAETFRAAATLLVRAGLLADAAALLRKQAPVYARQNRPHDVARTELSAVIVSLSAGDYERAATGCNQAAMRPGGFAGAPPAFAEEAACPNAPAAARRRDNRVPRRACPLQHCSALPAHPPQVRMRPTWRGACSRRLRPRMRRPWPRHARTARWRASRIRSRCWLAASRSCPAVCLRPTSQQSAIVWPLRGGPSHW